MLRYVELTDEEKEELKEDFKRYVQPSSEDIKRYNKEWEKDRSKESMGSKTTEK